MKTKKIFSVCVMLFSIIAISLGSCKKSNDTIEDEQTIMNDGLKTVLDQPMRTLYNVDYPFIGCAEPPHNCLPTVIIEGPAPLKSASKRKIVYNDFIEKFKNKKVAEFFNNGDYLTLFPKISQLPDALHGLQKSEIILYHILGVNDGLDYYIGLPKDVKFKSDWQGLEKCVFVINNK